MCSYVLLFITSFFIGIPVSFSAKDPRLKTCSQSFECGGITNIKYPFWGEGREEYCGHPSFHLMCQEDSVYIEIQTQIYRVLDINIGNQTLRIATTDTWSNNCPLPSHNISLLPAVYNYRDAFNEKLTLGYGCPPYPQPVTRFPCSVNETIDGDNYFWVNSSDPTAPPTSRCNASVTIPILKIHVQSLVRGHSTVEDVLKRGFDVGYNVDDGFCKRCKSAEGVCAYDRYAERTICLCHSDQSLWNICTPDLHDEGRTSYIVLGFVIAVMFLAMVPCYYGRTIRIKNEKTERVVEIFLKKYGFWATKRYSYADIKKITSSFSDKIGQGGYGGVYKGKLSTGRPVAIKLLNKGRGNREQFINEVDSISRTSHVNVVCLLGFCYDGSKRALIYEFMENGSLEKFINNPSEELSHLGWEKLFQIAVGVARGLEYLHRGCNTRILHFDIKPHNILLDKDFIPKISDFGLAKLCPRNESIISMLDARGTIGYIAPEVFSRTFGQVSHKSDVYSYGMMVLEITGRRKNIHVGTDHSSKAYFPHWIYKHLEQVEEIGADGVMPEEGMIKKKMILVALWCIQTNPTDRPSMTKVVEMLEGRDDLSIPPEPYLYSPPRSLIGSTNNYSTPLIYQSKSSYTCSIP